MNFWFLLGLGSVLYYLFLKSINKNVAFSKFFFNIGICFIIFSFIFIHLPEIIKSLIWLGFILIVISFCFYVAICILYQKKPLPRQIDTIFVFGAGLFGKRMSLSLQRRMEKAVILAALYPEADIIVSGGQGKDEKVTEAYAMSEYLLSKGISKERIYLEEKSTSTFENLSYSMRLYPMKGKKMALITNQFHVFRACQIAFHLGIDGIGVSARIHSVAMLVFYVREYFAYIKGKIHHEI